ncbi:MAG: hypothetical protein H6713_04605 [Myxococcales bacterium]|nr:hypothetical protein [Myxococcales bacterium]
MAGPSSVCEHGTPREQEVCGCPKGPMTASCTYEVAKLLEELNGAR